MCFPLNNYTLHMLLRYGIGVSILDLFVMLQIDFNNTIYGNWLGPQSKTVFDSHVNMFLYLDVWYVFLFSCEVLVHVSGIVVGDEVSLIRYYLDGTSWILAQRKSNMPPYMNSPSCLRVVNWDDIVQGHALARNSRSCVIMFLEWTSGKLTFTIIRIILLKMLTTILIYVLYYHINTHGLVTFEGWRISPRTTISKK